MELEIERVIVAKCNFISIIIDNASSHDSKSCGLLHFQNMR